MIDPGGHVGDPRGQGMSTVVEPRGHVGDPRGQVGDPRGHDISKSGP